MKSLKAKLGLFPRLQILISIINRSVPICRPRDRNLKKTGYTVPPIVCMIALSICSDNGCSDASTETVAKHGLAEICESHSELWAYQVPQNQVQVLLLNHRLSDHSNITAGLGQLLCRRPPQVDA